MFRPSMRLLSIVLFVGLSFTAPLSADILNISISGQFGSGIAADALAAPAASWAISFDVDSSLAAFNADISSFDTPFTNFSYLLNGDPVASVPDFIRFYNSSDGGLFGLFFGPETGFLNGIPIPEFSFSGAAVFSGTPDAPAIIPGFYPVADALYADAVNFDDEGAAGTVVITDAQVTATPEPSAFPLLAIGLIAICAVRAMRRYQPLSRQTLTAISRRTARMLGVAALCVFAIQTGRAQNAYIANSNDGTVTVIDTGSNSIRTGPNYPIPVGLRPTGVAVAPNGRVVYVANSGSNSVSVIDTATDRVVATVSVTMARERSSKRQIPSASPPR